MKTHFALALKNIINFGDTDIFPFPIENHIFQDFEEQTVELLCEIHSNFEQFCEKYPPSNQSALCPAGFNGFRVGTQIDPIWNAYLLGLIISVSQKIENARIKRDRDTVFSYRIDLDTETGQLFNPNISWVQFQNKSIEHAKKHKHVLICDISDFYPRIYHHRIENSLKQINPDGDQNSKIMKLLKKFSVNTSYGLPVGGPAARMLAELLLNKTDRLLASNGFKFCRFVDDYHIFTDSIEDAYKALIFISEKLSKNEGLTLQKNKTRIMPAEEFKINSEFYTKGSEQIDDQKRAFLQIHLRYDPYSPTADEDYERLKDQLSNFDILGLLKSELRKTNTHTSTMKRVLKAIAFLDQEPKGSAMITLLENLEKLFPVFPLVMIIISKVFEDLTNDHQDEILLRVRKLVKNNDYHSQIDLNLHFIVRVLAKRNEDESEECLVQIYRNTLNEAIKRDIILIMSMWGHAHWVSDIKNNFINLSPWEKRAFIIGSYSLYDEGKHWRDNSKGHFSPIENFYRDWASARVQSKGGLGGII